MKHLLPILATLALPLTAAEKPNILFIFSDDHSPNAISCYPGGLFDKISPTPGIDRIANEGMRFDNSFCANSICGPSRACILTGKHSHMNGFIDNDSSFFDGLQQTFPDLLRQAGYTTAMIGKWHLRSNPVGFDHWEILPGQGAYYNPDFVQMDNTRKRFEGHAMTSSQRKDSPGSKKRLSQTSPSWRWSNIKPHTETGLQHFAISISSVILNSLSPTLFSMITPTVPPL